MNKWANLDALQADPPRDLIGEYTARMLTLPPAGKKAADLDERERLAVAYASCGADLVEIVVDGSNMVMRSRDEFIVDDKPGGGYIVARAQP